MPFIDDLDLDTLNSTRKKDTTSLSDLDLWSLDIVEPTKTTPDFTPSEYIIPGTWKGSENPEYTTSDLDIIKSRSNQWLTQKFDLWETWLSESPDQWFFGSIRQTYRNFISWADTLDRKTTEIADRISEKAYQGWQEISQWEYTSWVWKIIWSTAELAWAGFEVPLNEQVSWEIWETVWMAMSVPFEAVWFSYKNILMWQWMDEANADNYSAWLAMLTLIWLWAGRDKKSVAVEQKKIVEDLKNPNISPKLKSIWNKNALIMHPDRAYKYSKEAQVKIQENFKDFNKAYNILKNEKLMNEAIVKTKKIIAEEKAKLKTNIRWWMDLTKFEKNPQNVRDYNVLKEEIKNDLKYSKDPIVIKDLVSDKIFWLFVNNPALEVKIEEKMLKELYDEAGVQPFKDEIEVMPKEDQELNKNTMKEVFEEWNPENLTQVIDYLDEIKWQIEWIEWWKEKFEQQIQYVEQSQSIWKEANLNAIYWKDINSVMSNLYLNNTKKNITQKTLDKYSDIEKNYIADAQKIDWYLEQKYQWQEKKETVQEAYEEFFDLKQQQSNRVKKPILEESKPIKKETEIVTEEKQIKPKTEYKRKDVLNAFQELEIQQILKNPTKFKKQAEELWISLDPKDFKDKEGFTPKTENMELLQNHWFMDKDWFFTDKIYEISPNFKTVYTALWKALHEPVFKVTKKPGKKGLPKTENKPFKKQPPKDKKIPTSEKIKKVVSKPKSTKQKWQTKVDKETVKWEQTEAFPTAEKLLKLKQTRITAGRIKRLLEKQTIPNTNDIVNLLKNTELERLQEATNWAVQKNMISKEQGEIMSNAFKSVAPKINRAPTGKLSKYQRNELLDMQGYQSIFKQTKDIKINLSQVSESLKNIWAKLHVVNPPEWKRVKLPFTLMWNKSATYRQVLAPMIKKWLEQGAKRFVEPFAGAWTSYYFAPEMFKNWLEEMHINHFDDEKFEVIKAVKESVWGWEWKMRVLEDVTEAFNTIIDEMWDILAEIPEIKSIMEDYDVQVWTKGFKDMAEIFFYPQYAKQFFEERPDTKLWIKWELSSTFKEWLIETKGKETWLTWEKLDILIDSILTDPSVFETRYPQISKQISTILDKYDNVQVNSWDYKTWLLKSVAKHLRQRWDSWQKVVSASGWFQNVIWTKEKMIDWLLVYKKTFIQHWKNIHIYKMDWKEFITKMWQNFNNLETMFYWDPPYLRTTGTYIKQTPWSEKALGEYADPSKIHKIFEPMKDSMMMFTNDIDWKYFEALDTMLGDRMSKDIIGYREWTTPTSLVTSIELQVKPKDVWLEYYQIWKDAFIKDMFQSLKKNLFPKITEQLKKPIAKLEQHYIKVFEEKFWELSKIQDQLFKWKEAFEKLNETLPGIVTGRDKQAILNEAKKWVKQNKVTGSELVKMIEKVNKLWVDREQKIKEFRSELSKTLKSDKIYAETKKDIRDWFAENYTEKRITWPELEAVTIIDNVANGIDIKPEEWEIYEKYLKDEKFHNKVELARKESIYNLDIDQIQKLTDTLRKQTIEWKDTIAYKEKQEQQLIDKHVQTGAKTVKFTWDKPADINYKTKDTTITEEKYKSQDEAKKGYIQNVKDLFSKTTPKEIKDKIEMSVIPVHWILDEKMWVARMVYDVIEQGRTDWQIQSNEIMERYVELTKKLKLDKKSFIKLALHWLSRRSDNNWVPKLVYELDFTWKDPATWIEVKTYWDIQFLIEKYKWDKYLSSKEQEMYDFMQDTFTKLWKEAKETALDIDNMFVEMLEEYFPIKGSLKDQTSSYWTPDTDLWWSLTNWLFKKIETEAWFLKKATWVKSRPELNADFVFRSNVYKVTYYNNMQRPIRILSRVKNQMVNSLWNLWYKYLTDYVDRLARQWIVWSVTPGWRLIAHQTRNVSKTFVSVNPASYMVQFSALLEWKAVWANINPLSVKNAFKNKKMIFEKSRILKTRDYTHVHGYEWLYKSIIDEITDKTMLPMAIVDKHVGMIIWYSMYKQSLKLGKDEKTAIFEADQWVKKTIADPSFFWKSQYHVENERGWGSITTMYNTFTSNLFWSTVYAWWRFAKSKYWKFARSHQWLFALVWWLIAMWVAQDISRRLLGGKKYPEELNVKIRDYLIWMIPQLGSIYGWSKYWGVWSLTAFNEVVKWVIEWDIRPFLHWLWLWLWIPGSHTVYKLEKNRLQRKKERENKKNKKRKWGWDFSDFWDIDFSDFWNINTDWLENLNLDEFNF